MFSTAVVLFAAGLSGFVSAQNSSSGTQSTYPYLLNPNDPLFTAENRTTACIAQRQSCPQLCATGAYPNTCDEQTLTYACQCNDGTTPNVTAYEQTLPFFECLQYRAECVAATTDAAVQLACNNITCGAKGSPADFAAQVSMSAAMASPTSTSASSSATAAPTSQTSAPAPASLTSSTGGAAIATAMSKNLGTGALVAGVFGGFAFLL